LVEGHEHRVEGRRGGLAGTPGGRGGVDAAELFGQREGALGLGPV
jgi:hypothetical protein